MDNFVVAIRQNDKRLRLFITAKSVDNAIRRAMRLGKVSKADVLWVKKGK